jgi:hypothetical protein
MGDPAERTISDPLSDVTRRERKMLLTVNVVALAIVIGNLIPTQIVAIGVTLSTASRQRLLLLLGGVLLYGLTTFIVYASADRVAWRADRNAFVGEIVRNKIAGLLARAELQVHGETNEVRERRLASLRILTDIHEEEWSENWHVGRRVYDWRAKFEFYFPVVLTSATLILLVMKALL